MMFPKNKWGKPERSPTGKAEIPEYLIQNAVNDYLSVKRIRYLRFPDKLWTFVKKGFSCPSCGRHISIPAWVQQWMGSIFGGRPDNISYIPIGDGYAFAMLLELKTQDSKGRAVGRTHGKQKHDEEHWVICRSVDEAIHQINEFEKTAEKIKSMLNKK